jgi:hypothetical protein
VTITAHLDALLSALTTWGADFNVIPIAAANRKDVLEFSSEVPTGLKVLVVFTGETMPEENSQALVVWRNFSVVMVRPFGWSLNRADNLAVGDATQSPLLFILESCRNAIISAQIGEAQELWPRYVALSEVDPGEIPADVWQLDFVAGALLAPLTA